MTMTRIASFWVPGEPAAEPRPRARALPNGRAQVYAAGTTKAWRACVAFASNAHRPAVPLDVPVRVDIAFHLPRPQRLRGPRRPPGPVLCDRKPDVDNLAKAVLDALTESRWWVDDSRVAILTIVKYYHRQDGGSGARVVVSHGVPPPE